MSRKQFADIIGREKGKVGFVLGLGPSLKDTMSLIMEYHKQKDIASLISCNNIDLMAGEIDFDYWMIAQPADQGNPLSIQNAFNRYNYRKNTTFLYTDCLEKTPKDTVQRLLTVDYIGYDQRHFNSEHCTWGKGLDGRAECCDHLEPGRLNIQEEFQKYTHYDRTYGAGDTVGVHMIALAVMLGLNPIFVTGIDLDYTNGYVNNEADVNIKARVELGKMVMAEDKIMPRILSDISIIRDAARNIGTNIYVLTPGKLSEVLPVGYP